MAETPNRVCVIGAGSSGIAACKVLQDHGIPFDCFETGSQVGGNWQYGNDNQMSSAYKSLFINTSRPRMQYSDYPMPKNFPVYPHHTQIAAYFNDYVDHFGFRDKIRFSTAVSKAEPLEGGGWEITLSDGTTQRYRALLVASGHHWDPRWPEPAFPGEFQGEVSHSHYYRDPEPYTGKRVLVLGFGNSAMDIAVETSRVSEQTFLSVRRGFRIIPKYLFGRPVDQIHMPAFVPYGLQLRLLHLAISMETGNLTHYGLPKPEHRVGQAHPTISSEILNRITHGRVIVKPTIKQLDGDGVIFSDGSREQIEQIIYCTGYKITFPFFEQEVIEAPGNNMPLYEHVFSPRYRDLFFIGLVQPLGAIMPLAETQSILVSKYLLGSYGLPSEREMQQAIQRERAQMRRRYGDSPRHTIQVDFDPYQRELYKEIQRGSSRAGKGLLTPEPTTSSQATEGRQPAAEQA